MGPGWNAGTSNYLSEAGGAGDYRMSLIDPPADKPDRSRAMAFTVAALVLVAIVALWYTFRYYPEKKAAERFFDALVSDNTDLTYQLWTPAPTYTLKPFLAYWGHH